MVFPKIFPNSETAVTSAYTGDIAVYYVKTAQKWIKSCFVRILTHPDFGMVLPILFLNSETAATTAYIAAINVYYIKITYK